MLPVDVDKVHVDLCVHFRNTWMRRWNGDQFDLREAIREADKVQRSGKSKWEIYVRKKGEKKLLVAYQAEFDEVFVITGAEG